MNIHITQRFLLFFELIYLINIVLTSLYVYSQFGYLPVHGDIHTPEEIGLEWNIPLLLISEALFIVSLFIYILFLIFLL